jgi:hypothetical protein
VLLLEVAARNWSQSCIEAMSTAEPLSVYGLQLRLPQHVLDVMGCQERAQVSRTRIPPNKASRNQGPHI